MSTMLLISRCKRDLQIAGEGFEPQPQLLQFARKLN